LAGAVNGIAAGGSVTGHVVVTKSMTKKRVSLPAYDLRGVAVSSANKPASSNPTLDELSRVFVYLEGPGLKAAPATTATLTQKNRQFDPEIVVVPAGSIVSFPNEDPIFHNVFSLSKAKEFDLGYYPAGQTRSVKVEKPGIVQVYCHIHPDMSAAIVVLSNVFWMRPQEGGAFNFSSVPAGSYELVAWHRSAGFFRRHITVTEGGSIDENFVIPVKEVDASNPAKPGGGQ
jgi:plastocyanin